MSDAPAAPVTENGVPPAAQEKIDETPGFKVFAGNLAYSTTDEGLKTFFAPVHNDIITAQVILRGVRSAGYGFVSLSSAEAAQKAVEELHQKELDGRTVIVEIAKPADQKEAKKEKRVKRKTNRRGSKAVPGELTEAEANGAIVTVEGGAAPAADEAAKPKKSKKSKRKPKRKTPAEGEATSAEGAAVPAGEGAADSEAKKPRVRKPRAPRTPRPAGEEPTGEPSKSILFVANIGFEVGEEELSAIFTDAGIKVNSARIVRRRWGKPRKSKGYGFVDVGDEEEQKKAIELLQGKEIGGRPIAVKVAVNSQQAEADEAAESGEAAAPRLYTNPPIQTALRYMFSIQTFFSLLGWSIIRELSNWCRNFASSQMSDDEDDYLSDKFLAQAASSSSTTSTKTYTERRKEEQRRAAIRNEENRKRSRRELELESRQEGLSRSLFEQASDDGDGGSSAPKNKALAMMMKMGFKPGQALGPSSSSEPPSRTSRPPAVHRAGTPDRRASSDSPEHDSDSSVPKPQHRTVPLPLNEWAGKKGIGLGSKRATSPSAAERLAKMSKMADERDHADFRDRARQEYEERRAEGRLGPAQSTCVTLDEKAGREFNVLWLNPNNPDTFPEGLVDALEDPSVLYSLKRRQHDGDIEGRLRTRMQADALQPLTSTLEDDDETSGTGKQEANKTPYSEEDIKEAEQFLRLGPSDRLELVLDYLRRRYAYCFWCGTEYEDQNDMEQNCPGADEDAHD
ncbi:hypothetical protein BC835DRAFT_1307044 [Cytidiella melzeri]|nr:hypothetical protein BC835DRAFT_1307044 [Cytidiella melzeri]